jgi:hypothetical protein
MNHKRLMEILRHNRGNQAYSQEVLTQVFLQMSQLNPSVDIHGNFLLRIPLPDGSPSRTIFCAHYDTVDPIAYCGVKLLVQEGHTVRLMSGGGCLGADDGAGCEVLMSMAEAGIPGLYCWFWGEESGGKGSRGFLMDSNVVAKDYDRVISFDRRGTYSIISDQWLDQTASDEFCQELARQLHMGHTQDPTGTFTDSAVFSQWGFSECTNVSVGYQKEHTKEETLDLQYLSRLITRCLKVSWETLPVGTIEQVNDYGLYSSERKPHGTLQSDCCDLVMDYPKKTAEFLRIYGLESEFIEHMEEELYYGKKPQKQQVKPSHQVSHVWSPDTRGKAKEQKDSRVHKMPVGLW